MPWRLVITSILCVLILSATAYAADAATLPRLGLPEDITLSQIVSSQKIKVTWTEPKHANKYVFKVVQGKTVIIQKTVKQPRVTFSESKIVHGETYSLRVRAKATATRRASFWQKKKLTFTDVDFDDDGEVAEDDTDDDGDGLIDSEEDNPNDHDNDGLDDASDTDDDNDLLEDADDAYPLDHDNDGDPDVTDPDDDNDGILDVDEAPGQQFDEDNDGIEDYLDEDYIAAHQPTETFTIRIKSNSFVDGDIIIAVGDTVKWVNKDEGGHAVAATDGSFESPPLESGESYSYTFTEAGSYDYYDPTAPDTTALTGTITVSD